MSTQITDKDLIAAGYIPAGTPPAQIAIFMEACKAGGFNPALKEVHLIKSKVWNRELGGYEDRYYNVVSIDAKRRKAHETGAYIGKSDVLFNLKADGTFLTMADVIASKQDPMTATVKVKKAVGGHIVDFQFTVAFKEYIKKTDKGKSTHDTMPLHMIGKVAESHALNSAFPAMASFHIPEELPAIEGTTLAAEEAKPMSLAEGAKQNDLEQSIQRFIDGIQDATAEEAAALFRTLPDVAKKSPMAVDALQSRTVAYWCGELDRMEFASQQELDNWCSGISPKVAGLLQTSEQWQALYLAKIAVPSSELFNGR